MKLLSPERAAVTGEPGLSSAPQPAASLPLLRRSSSGHEPPANRVFNPHIPVPPARCPVSAPGVSAPGVSPRELSGALWASAAAASASQAPQGLRGPRCERSRALSALRRFPCPEPRALRGAVPLSPDRGVHSFLLGGVFLKMFVNVSCFQSTVRLIPCFHSLATCCNQ